MNNQTLFQPNLFGIFDGDLADYVKHNFLLQGDLKNTFLEIDSKIKVPDQGSTASVALIEGDTVTLANAGDSRWVVAKNGRVVKASEDHTFGIFQIKDAIRIKKAGGEIKDKKLDGVLNISRALGYYRFKNNSDLAPE